MSRVRRAHYAALLGLAIVATGLLVTVAGEWRDVQSVAGVVTALLAVLLVLKAISVLVIIGLRSVF
ncbi:hypothetical protein [Halorussus salinisoli]|uniref:hypothetical protein n=1 Tax=Halorussus salinisoli TaxID=2558242 RepID=UPI0010C22448|nr:hypothetical protein [Halorussus salinisoli]